MPNLAKLGPELAQFGLMCQIVVSSFVFVCTLASRHSEVAPRMFTEVLFENVRGACRVASPARSCSSAASRPPPHLEEHMLGAPQNWESHPVSLHLPIAMTIHPFGAARVRPLPLRNTCLTFQEAGPQPQPRAMDGRQLCRWRRFASKLTPGGPSCFSGGQCRHHRCALQHRFSCASAFARIPLGARHAMEL